MKKKIALCANGWNGENLENFIDGLKDIFTDDDIDLFVFTSYASYTQSSAMRAAEHSIYGMPDYSVFDAVILFGSGINSDEVVETILKKCKEADVPVIMQGNDQEGMSSVTVDNYAGMRSLCDHLIEQHNVKDVVFIAGTEDNEDSNLRLQALKDSLNAHGICGDNVQIVYANWERNLVQKHIFENYTQKENLPDAIVCANDPMALFALVSLEILKIKVPDEVIVTGFDDLNDGRLFFPSVASVNQCYREQGNESAKIIQELLKNKRHITKKIIPCTAVPGESCGCINCKNEAEVRKMLGHDVLQKKYLTGNLQGREAHVETCILSSREYKDIANNMRTDLFATKGVEGDDFHILINPSYKDLAYMDQKEQSVDEYYSPVMDVLASKSDGVINLDETMNTRELLVGYKSEGKAQIYVFCPLRLGSAVAGYMVMGHSKGFFSDNIYRDFSGHLDRALDRYQGNMKMARLNEKLSEMMEKDSLTSVKNRIAYDNYMKKMDQTISEGKELHTAILMCDINNLKTINDKEGHDAGDLYIKNCCKMMCDTFKHSPIFRIGGDEFVIVVNNEDFSVREERLAEMRKKMEELAVSNVADMEKVSIATGMADFEPAKDKSLSIVVKKADVLMYMNKAEMKAKH